MKVLKDFFCIQEKVTYKKGDDYKGKRTDLKGYLNQPKRVTKKK